MKTSKNKVLFFITTFITIHISSTQAHLNFVQVFPYEKNEKSQQPQDPHLPALIIFDFASSVDVHKIEHAIENQTGELQLFFPNMKLQEFVAKNVTEQLVQIPYIRQATLAVDNKNNTRTVLTISFAHESHLPTSSKSALRKENPLHQSGIEILLERISAPHNATRIMINLYPKKVLERLSKHTRGYISAHASATPYSPRQRYM